MEFQQRVAEPSSPALRPDHPRRSGAAPSPLLTFPPNFDLDFARRLLGGKEGRKLSPSTARRLASMQDRFGDLLKPRVTYEERHLTRLTAESIVLEGGIVLRSRKMARSLRGARTIVAFVATVGKKVDRTIDTLMRNGQLANAYVGDALGSAAAEKLADTFQNHLDTILRTAGRTTGPRFSPGYCDWPITEQHKLFRMVKGAVAGVTLGDTALMHPRKSISAICGVYDLADVPETKYRIPCLRCGKKDCIARRTEADA